MVPLVYENKIGKHTCISLSVQEKKNKREMVNSLMRLVSTEDGWEKSKKV